MAVLAMALLPLSISSSGGTTPNGGAKGEPNKTVPDDPAAIRRDKTIADCTETIRLNPNDVEAYSVRGLVYLGIGNFDRAIADFDEAIRRDPKDAKAYGHRAMAYRAKGDARHAEADHAEAVRLDPTLK